MAGAWDVQSMENMGIEGPQKGVEVLSVNFLGSKLSVQQFLSGRR